MCLNSVTRRRTAKKHAPQSRENSHAAAPVNPPGGLLALRIFRFLALQLRPTTGPSKLSLIGIACGITTDDVEAANLPHPYLHRRASLKKKLP
jgi:hypothetical protein